MAPNKYIKELFGKEEELTKEQKEERKKELEDSSEEKAPLSLSYFSSPATSAVLDILQREEGEGPGRTTAKGLAKFGFDETFLEAIGSAGGMAGYLKLLAQNPGMLTKVSARIPFIPKTPIGLLGVFLADTIGATTGAILSKLEQGGFEERTQDVESFWEQVAIAQEILGEEIKENAFFAALGPVVQGVLIPFRKFLAGVKEPGKQYYEKAAKYLENRDNFSMAEVGEGPGAKILSRLIQTFGQVPIIGTPLTETAKRRSIALTEIFGDFVNKVGRKRDINELSEDIFVKSAESFNNFKKIVGNLKNNVFVAETKAIEAAGPRFTKNIPTNRFTDFLENYTQKLERAYGGGKPLAEGMSGYNEFYAFAKKFFLPSYKNSRVSFETFQDVILPELRKTTEIAIKNNQVGFNMKVLNDAFSSYNKLIEDIVDPQKVKGFNELSPEAQNALKLYSDSIKDYKSGFAILKRPFERVLAGDISKVDKLLFDSGRKINQEELRRYVDDIVSPLLKKLTPRAVDDLKVLVGGDKALVGELVRAYIEKGIKASTTTTTSKGLMGGKTEQTAFNPKAFVDFFGLEKGSLNTQKKTLEKLFSFLDDIPTDQPFVTGSRGIDFKVFSDILDLMVKQAEVPIPNVNKYLTRNIGLGGKGPLTYLKRLPQLGFVTAALGSFPSVTLSVLGVRMGERALTNPAIVERVVKGLDVTLPLAARDNAIVRIIRSLADDKKQQLADNELNDELKSLTIEGKNPYSETVDDLRNEVSLLDGILGDENLLNQKVKEIREAIDNSFVSTDTGINQGTGQNDIQTTGNSFVDRLKFGEPIEAEDIITEETISESKVPQISVPEVTRGQGELLPGFSITPQIETQIQQNIDPNVLKNLESVGLPLFENFKDGGIVDLYESKKFKKPQVVA